MPFVIGHAAAGGEAPHNTLAGVQKALDAGCEAMEIDVQLCAEGIPVLMHDETVNRTTDLSGPVRSIALAELQRADAGEGQHVPGLDEVLDLVAGRLTVMCELKSTRGDEAQDSRLVDAVLATVDRHEAWWWTAIHSFNPQIVAWSRERQPRLSAAIISGAVEGDEYSRLLGAVLKRGAQAISINHACVDAEVVRHAKQRQLTIWTWTPDTETDWARCIEAGVDGIITNYPRRLGDFLSRG
jgi:glycerophosphoryl diester phosphodiesterase